ncbi:PREDICTED: uncharacterized protein LOC107064541 isoform X2 [Polistes dominula]|uniref:Uncharacterized protein LOC107064541 isoform X2 n=1 Tax=Polistes dominula TaxID=743375 RepID=A0ABM1HXY0_POLDO|nr:PREDICTED: uncharacterized protein LOC107064541 isoform X2 [Polistes dominula]
MGQAWCKEKTSKAQDSKSPLDRVFVRCAHRIYPSLKEEGSVLGGATQRVTSSEIGYAGSPPRDVLTRGRSIDSVDRPFQPSDWVDVNLEVPSTPRPNSVLTNLTIDTNLYPPTTTPTSIRSNNLKDVTPVPPPRRKKRNRGRPLPPKPDEIADKTMCNLRHVDSCEEPLYSSVVSNNSPRMLLNDYATMEDVVGRVDSDDDDGGGVGGGDVGMKKKKKKQQQQQESEDEGCIYRNQTNGTRDSPRLKEYSKGVMPEGKRTKEIYEHKVNGTGRIISSEVVSGKRLSQNYDKKIHKNTNQNKKINDTEEYERFVNGRTIKDSSSTPNQKDNVDTCKRSKELLIKRQIDDTINKNDGNLLEANIRPKNYSTVSLPNYDELDVGRYEMKRNNDEQGEHEKIRSRRPVRSSTGSLPVESFLQPFSQKTSIRLEDYISRHGSTENLSEYEVLEGKLPCTDSDGKTEFLKYDSSKLEDWDIGDIGNCELNHHQRPHEDPDIADRDVVDFHQTRENTHVVQKPVSFGKPTEFVNDTKLNCILMEQDRCIQEETKELSKPDKPPLCKEPVCSNRINSFYSDNIGGEIGKKKKEEEEEEEKEDDFDRSNSKRMIFGRSLSNESEPNDPVDVSCETKELRLRETNKMIRTISEELLTREMLPDRNTSFFDGDDEKNLKMKKIQTPPPSPENKIKAEIVENEHSILLKVLKEEAALAAEGSNFSSMTPSLTELEVALSDMLEKEQNDQQDISKNEHHSDDRSLSPSGCNEQIEPKIIPIDKHSDRRNDLRPVSLGDILKKNSPKNQRKVSFCAWEEKELIYNDDNDDDDDDDDSRVNKNYDKKIIIRDKPDEPMRRYSLDDSIMNDKSEDTPTPPRRRHRPSCPSGILREDQRTSINGAKIHSDTEHGDRLI